MDVEFLDVGLAPGCSLHVDYACPACGTKYATAALAGRDGMFVSGGRVRA
jgi:hypothetical protein